MCQFDNSAIRRLDNSGIEKIIIILKKPVTSRQLQAASCKLPVTISQPVSGEIHPFINQVMISF